MLSEYLATVTSCAEGAIRVGYWEYDSDEAASMMFCK